MEPFNLPTRSGPRPQTTKHTPHSQIDQHGPAEIAEKLAHWAFSLADVDEQPSRISVPGARALVLNEDTEADEQAFMVGREFAHIHPYPDLGSLHLKLPQEDAEEVVQQGWGEHHLLVETGMLSVGFVMVYAPRDDMDLKVVKQIVERAYQYANFRI